MQLQTYLPSNSILYCLFYDLFFVNILRCNNQEEELAKLTNFSAIVGWVFNMHSNESQN